MSEPDVSGNEGGGNQEAEAAVQKVQKRIEESFDVFDHEGNKTVDVREIGTIMRSLDLCPTENELTDVLAEIEEEDAAGCVRLERFLPVMTLAIMSKNYRPHTDDKILKAFQTLDPDGKGFLTQDILKQYLTTEGEPFNDEEMEEMMSAAIDDKGNIVFKEFIPLMAVEEDFGS